MQQPKSSVRFVAPRDFFICCDFWVTPNMLLDVSKPNMWKREFAMTNHFCAAFFRWDISVIFLLRHFGHLSHSSIKACHNSVQQPMLSDILTEMT